MKALTDRRVPVVDIWGTNLEMLFSVLMIFGKQCIMKSVRTLPQGGILDMEKSETDTIPDEFSSIPEEQTENCDEEELDDLHIEWAGYV